MGRRSLDLDQSFVIASALFTLYPSNEDFAVDQRRQTGRARRCFIFIGIAVVPSIPVVLGAVQTEQELTEREEKHRHRAVRESAVCLQARTGKLILARLED